MALCNSSASQFSAASSRVPIAKHFSESIGKGARIYSNILQQGSFKHHQMGGWRWFFQFQWCLSKDWTHFNWTVIGLLSLTEAVASWIEKTMEHEINFTHPNCFTILWNHFVLKQTPSILLFKQHPQNHFCFPNCPKFEVSLRRFKGSAYPSECLRTWGEARVVYGIRVLGIQRPADPTIGWEVTWFSRVEAMDGVFE